MTLLTGRVSFPPPPAVPGKALTGRHSAVCFLGDFKPCLADSHSQPSHLPTIPNAETRDLAEWVSQFAFLLL